MRLNLNNVNDYFTINNKFFEVGDITKDDVVNLRNKEEIEEIRERVADFLKKFNKDSKVDNLNKKELNRIGVLISDVILWEKK